MEFVQRSGDGPPPGTTSAPIAEGGGGVASILAAYGVEPARKGSRPEMDDEDEDTGLVGSSGEGPDRGSARRAARRRSAFDRAMLEQVAGPGVLSGTSHNRRALEEKYPAIRDGGR